MRYGLRVGPYQLLCEGQTSSARKNVHIDRHKQSDV